MTDDPAFQGPEPALPHVEKITIFHRNWGPDRCIDALRALQASYPERNLTRNFFRNETGISDSTWSRYFGSFAEFKRQAGIEISRHQHRMELDVARHASLDAMRELSREKTNWGDAYLKPAGGRYRTAVICSDIHDVTCDPFWKEVLLDTIRRAQPDLVVVNGDLFDLPEFGKYQVDPRAWDAVSRIRAGQDFLREVREAAPEAQIDLIEGNHEYRLLRHLSESSPAMQAVLSDLHGMTIQSLLGLEQFEVNYVAPANLAALTKSDMGREVRRNFRIYWDSFLCCHFPEARDYGFPGFSGHHHKYKVWEMYSPRFGSYKWVQLGCGHRREAEYTFGEKWDNGFALAHVDADRNATVMEYIDVKDHAVAGGKWFTRT